MTFPDDDTRGRIRAELDTTLVVEAGAGTGKTTALVGRIVELVRSGRAAMRDVAAITFTESAAAELRHRVRGDIAEAAALEPTNLRLAAADHEVDDATMCTLHAFAQRILIDHCVAAGVPPGFDVLDETAERADFAARLERFADALFADPGAETAVVRGFSVGLTRLHLHDMAWELHRHWDRLEDGGLAALEAARPRPGRWPPAEAAPVLGALDAALALAPLCRDDSDKLLVHLGVLALTRHALAACPDDQATLQYLSHRPPFSTRYGQAGNWGGRADEVRAACAAAEDARQELLGATHQAVLAELGARLAAFVMGAADERRAEGRLGFHDLLVHARRLLRRDPAATTALRHRYRFLLVDEFQDTDPIQVELAARLAAAVDGGAQLGATRPGGLFVVGDPKQSIYRFRRADVDAFERVGQEVGERILLVTNFRSVPGIVGFVNTVFEELFGEAPVAGQAAHHALQPARLALPPTCAPPTDGARAPGAGPAPVQLALDGLATPEPPAPGPAARPRPPARTVAPVVLLGGPLRESVSDVRRAAARDVALALAHLIETNWAVLDTEAEIPRPARWRDIAVLLPARTALPALEDAFEDARIPYRLEGVAMLWGADEVRDVLAVLGAVDEPADRVAVLGALRSPGLACGDDDLVTWRGAGGSWDPRHPAPEGLDEHPVARAMAVIAALHGRRWWCEPSVMVGHTLAALRSFELCLAYHRPRDHWHRLRWLQDQARLFDETVGGRLRAFLQWAALQAEDDRRSGGVGPPDPDDDAVRVMTIHGAKGLEFPVVVLAGLEREGAGTVQPAVLWDDDGTPRFRARDPLVSDNYKDLAAHERGMDELERLRLLYVGMTRARDHLVLCLHHKETTSGSTTVAAQLHGICARHDLLWRRLPVEVIAGPGAEDDDEDTSPARPDGLAIAAGDDEVAAWWDGVAAFADERAGRLAAGRRAPVTTATAVAAGSGSGAAAGPDPGSPDATGPLWRDGDTGLQIGRAVHSALAAIDLERGTDDAGRPPSDVARARATAQGIAEHGDVVVAMVDAALAAPSVRAGVGRRHWRELYVAVPVGGDEDAPDGGVLEGFVDLVVERDGGLVVVDYKTDHAPDDAARRRAAARYGPQVAAYALALEEATGQRVARAVLVFLSSAGALEVTLEGAALEEARGAARAEAQRLVGAVR